jgi:hypothetical protein
MFGNICTDDDQGLKELENQYHDYSFSVRVARQSSIV